MWSADFRQSFLSFIFLRWKIKIKTQTQLFVRFRIDKTNPNANRLKSNGKESAMCSTHDWIAAQGIPFHSHNSQIWGYVDGERERESAEQNRTEETRSWDLHVFIAEVLQIWIMQILSLQNKNKKATFAIPSINFLTSQKHPPLSNFNFSLPSNYVF